MGKTKNMRDTQTAIKVDKKLKKIKMT